MRRNFSVLSVHTKFDVPKCKFVLKDGSLKCWLCFRLKAIFRYIFGAPLKDEFPLTSAFA